MSYNNLSERSDSEFRPLLRNPSKPAEDPDTRSNRRHSYNEPAVIKLEDFRHPDYPTGGPEVNLSRHMHVVNYSKAEDIEYPGFEWGNA